MSERAESRIRLRILQTTDLHGALRGYDYMADRPVETIGLSRTATLIEAARKEAENTLLFDAGDCLQGSPVCDLAVARGLADGQVHPMIAMMNALKFDAMTPGNHDLDFGVTFMRRAFEDATFPVVSSNLMHRRADGAPGEPVLLPEVVLVREMRDSRGRMQTLRIGVLGCLPQQTLCWNPSLKGRLHVAEMLPTIRARAAALRPRCDLLVVLAHCGLSGGANANGERAAIDFAALEDVDVVLSGHTHLPFPAPSAPRHPAVDAARGADPWQAGAVAGVFRQSSGGCRSVADARAVGGVAAGCCARCAAVGCAARCAGQYHADHAGKPGTLCGVGGGSSCDVALYSRAAGGNAATVAQFLFAFDQ
jgi:2',3'-cyclic-nucleotide 2'-phosphodiesterase/3'-nucleotidase